MLLGISLALIICLRNSAGSEAQPVFANTTQ